MLLTILSLFANTCSTASPESGDSKKVSEALGHMIGKHLEELGLPIDWKALAKGLQDEAAGKDSPLDEEACLQVINALQEKKQEEIAQKNLAEAEEFLTKYKIEPAIRSLAEGKLLYQTVREGDGQEVQPYNSPIVRLKGRYLNGKPFSENTEEELLTLDEAIPAFRLGLVGMKEGEVRTLFVHPELGYGKEGHLAPNALLIFDVEVLRADAGADEETRREEISITR